MLADALARQRLALLADREPPDRRAANATRRRPNRTVLLGATLACIVVIDPFVALIVATTAIGVVRGRPILSARRAATAAGIAVPDALELFVLMVHAGLTPRQAIELLADRAPVAVRHGFAAVVARLERGDPLADALRHLPDTLGPAALGLADLIGSSDRYGLPLAPVLEQLATQVRADRRRADDAAARSLPVKLAFPLVVCTLPSFVLLAIVPAVMAALSSLQGASW